MSNCNASKKVSGMREDYKAWLAAQGYADNTQVAQINRVQKVEQSYGSLDDIVAKGGYNKLFAELTYSTADEKAGRPNPSQIKFDGNIRTNLASYKSAVARYMQFLSNSDMTDVSSPTTVQSQAIEASLGPTGAEKQSFSLERDMQKALRSSIAQLEQGLLIIDDGAERAVISGFIDILCRDANGAVVVVELKAGKTDAKVIGQVLGYMGDIVTEDEAQNVRGIIVAHDFDQRTRSASKAVPNLRLMRYAISFRFDADA
jgi:hypothetical protein